MDDLIYIESPAELLLSDIENAVDRIGLPNLLNGLHIGAFEESDVVKLCEFLSQTIAKMKREGERLTEYSAVFLKTFATDDNGYYDCGAFAAACQGDCCGNTRQEEDEKGEDDRWNRGFYQESG